LIASPPPESLAGRRPNDDRDTCRFRTLVVFEGRTWRSALQPRGV